MAITEIPPSRASGEDPVLQGDLADGYVELDAPAILLQVQDDLSRARVREAFWISVVVHLAIILLLANSQRIFHVRPIPVMTAEDLMRQNDTTFLALPPDEQKLTERPKTNTLSDKDRVATSKNPTLNRKELEKILDQHRAGPRGPEAQPQQPSPAQPPAPAQQQGPQVAQQAPPQQQPQKNPPNQTAQLESLPRRQTSSQPNPFAAALNSGTSTAQLARQAAAARAGGQSVGGGDLGMGLRGGGNIKSDMEIITDTQGVDFGPYLSRVVEAVRMNWYNLIPESARSPLFKQGVVGIQFYILPDGKVAGMQLYGPSGDVALDRAAWGGISASNPFPPLPSAFHGAYLGLRFRFFYNPNRKDLH